MSDIRSRAILFARQLPLSADVVNALVCILDGKELNIEVATTQLRIGIDNMIATGFEMGYAARGDDQTPRRALVDRLPWSRRARAERLAAKLSQQDQADE